MQKPGRHTGKAKRPNSADATAPAAGGPSKSLKHALLLAAIIGFTLLAYSNSFQAPFLFDNNEIILKDTRVHAATADAVRRILTGPYWEVKLAGLYRPLTMLTYLFNYAVLGNGAAPAGYHWINFLLHVVNIGLVYALGLAIFERIRPAAILSACWAIHPVLTESVTNIVGRADLLAAFGVLAALLSYRKAQGSAGRGKAAWLAASALFAAIGVFSKESGIVVIGVLVLYDLAFARAVSWRTRWAGYAAVAIPCIAYLAARARVLATVPAEPVPFVDNPLAAAGFWTSRLTAVKVIGKYLFLLVWPARLSCDYSYNEVPLFGWNPASWEDWKTLLALLVCAAAAGAALLLYRRDRRVFFGVAFFFVTLSPTSNLVLKIGTIMAERFLYLPSLGFWICVVCALQAAWRRLALRRPAYRSAAAGGAALVLLAGAVRTYSRNRDWTEEQRFWRSAMEAAPGSYKPLVMAASTAPLLNTDEASRAVTAMGRAMAILDPLPDVQNAGSPYRDAGTFYRRLGDRLADARNGAIRLSQTAPEFWYRKALDALLRCERIELARDEIYRRENAHLGNPGLTFLDAPLYLELGRTYLRLSDFPRALGAFERGRSLESDPDLLEELAALYRRMDNPSAAAGALVEALAVDSSRSQIGNMLIELYSQVDPGGCAVVQNAGVRELNPGCPLVHADICRASHNVIASYLRRGQTTEAAAIRQTALQDLGCAAALLD